MSKPAKAKPSNIAEAIASVVSKGTRKWTAIKKSEERQPSQVRYRNVRMTAERGLSQKDAAAQVMETAYLKASSNGTLPANARQVMYAARPMIAALTSKPLDDKYFTQTLLPDFVEENGHQHWDIVFDARGHFTEPHNRLAVDLGTVAVRKFLEANRPAEFQPAKLKAARVYTCGPNGNFGAVLFIEKEGFQALFERVQLAEQHDIAIMSTKGVSVTAARTLVDTMCGKHGIPLLVLHDFDVAGFTILDTLRRDTRRYRFTNDITVISLGLRLDDVKEMGLQAEAAASSKSDAKTIRARLKAAGATTEECEFLLTQRVELNAMTSAQFIDLIKRKLAEHGISKIVPPKQELDKAYQLLRVGRRQEEAFNKLAKSIGTDDVPAPADLDQRVRDILKASPEWRWDAAVRYALLVDEKVPAP